MQYFYDILFPCKYQFMIESNIHGTEISIQENPRLAYSNTQPIAYNVLYGHQILIDSIYWLLLNNYIEPPENNISSIKIQSNDLNHLLQIHSRLIKYLLHNPCIQIP